MQADRSSSIQAYRHSGIQVGMFSYKHVGRCVCMQTGILACKPAGSHAVTQSRSQACWSTRRSEGAPAVQHYQEETKIFFQKKTEKGKKEKESNLKGRDADRPKGIGISPEGCLVRNEQDIMPKSFCQTAKARHTFGFFLLFLLIKI